MKPTGDPRIDLSTHSVIVGSDEAGFGAYAGPLVVAAVAVPRDWTDPRVKDSKKLSESQREALYEEFWKPEGFPMCVEIVEPSEIDTRGVWTCLLDAHYKVTHGMGHRLVYEPLIVVDGNLPVPDAISLPKADNLVPACSLASIIAKVTRDRIMADLDKLYPEWGFGKHKGYGVPEHQAALDKFGTCPAHRKSYEPVARAIRETTPHQEDWSILDDC
jgi:ribonuclease HII